MDDAPGDALKDIIDGYSATKLVNYLGVGGHTLIVIDFIHTFPAEFRLMWPTPFSAPKVLFFALRYYIFVHHGFATAYGLPTGLSPSQCSQAFTRIAISSIITMIASEGILFIRVYAFSGRNKKLLVFLIIQFLAIHASAFALLYKFIHTVKFVKFPIENLVCMPAAAENTLLSGVFSLLLGSIVIVMSIMMYIAIRKHRNFNSALLTVFYRDGIFYFICLSALATANIVVNLAAPNGGMKFLLVQTEVDLHVILSTRMLLHLRSWAERDRRAGGRGTEDGGALGAFEYSTQLYTRDTRPHHSSMKFERFPLDTIHSVSSGTETRTGTNSGMTTMP